MSSYRFLCAGDAREEAQEAEAPRGRQGAQEAEKGEEAEKATPQSGASGRNGQRILAHAIVTDLIVVFPQTAGPGHLRDRETLKHFNSLNANQYCCGSTLSIKII